MVAQQIAPRAINRTSISQQVTFSVQVGNPTKKTGQFYVDPVAMTADGVPSMEIEQGIRLSARKVTLRSGKLRRVNAVADMSGSDRTFFVCTSPAEPTIIHPGSSTSHKLGIRARACSRVNLKQK
ncbi:hypothetical protein [Acaryochloris sp. IP29b_bin.148]|uniref:hypothetical protein n=1 Tax=Acaryochloris sp. IP29b_bin.148 TaxID=2969218 RepID=UPI00261E49F3|nr:hypothetical protein [Acaryochloris sp. IP29b_bin.148]